MSKMKLTTPRILPWFPTISPPIEHDEIMQSCDVTSLFEFIEKAFFAGLTTLSSINFLTVTPLTRILMTNQECKVRPEIVNVDSDEPVFYPFSIKTSKCSGNCNNINDPYAKIFLMLSRTNETRYIK